jgi:hypothetical protein
MHDPRKGHMDTVYHILRYLKSAPEKDLIFRKNEHMNIDGQYLILMVIYYAYWRYLSLIIEVIYIA